MALTIPERIAQVAEHFARHDAHGYSQPNRGTGGTERVTLSDGSTVTVTSSDVDCSEMVRQCVNAALSGSHASPIVYLWTGNQDEELRAQGFVRMAYDPARVRRGDVLWVSGHTGIALGGGLQADAHGDEYGGITGPNKGDQTAHEVEIRSLRSWDYIYRHAGDNAIVEEINRTYTAAGETNVRDAPSMGARITGTLRPGEHVSCDQHIIAERKHWYGYSGFSGKRLFIFVGDVPSWGVIS